MPNCFSINQSPAHTAAWGCSRQEQVFSLPHIEFFEVSHNPFLQSVEIFLNDSTNICSSILYSCVVSVQLLGMYCVPSFRSLMKVKTVMTLVLAADIHHLEFVGSKCFEPSSSVSFQPTLLYICLPCASSDCLGLCYERFF